MKLISSFSVLNLVCFSLLIAIAPASAETDYACKRDAVNNAIIIDSSKFGDDSDNCQSEPQSIKGSFKTTAISYDRRYCSPCDPMTTATSSVLCILKGPRAAAVPRISGCYHAFLQGNHVKNA